MGVPQPPEPAGRHYKGYRVYAYITLARLFAELNLDLGQADLELQVAGALERYSGHVSKDEILHAIRSNSHMTDKVVEYLAGEGFALVNKDERGYNIRITLEGVRHLRKFDRLYRELFGRELREHYRYVGSPDWLAQSSGTREPASSGR